MTFFAVAFLVKASRFKILAQHKVMKHFSSIATAAVMCASLIAAAAMSARAESSMEWEEKSRLSAISCDGLGTFTLNTNQRPSSSQLPSLCSCLIKETNQKGWEIDTLEKLNSGEEVGFIMKNGAIARFGQAVDSCSADKYYLSDNNLNDQDSNQDEVVNLSTQRLLGFLGGGPIGVVVAPWAYNLFGRNLIAWIIAGVIIGGFLWQLSIVLFMSAFSLLSSILRSDK